MQSLGMTQVGDSKLKVMNAIVEIEFDNRMSVFDNQRADLIPDLADLVAV